MMYRAVKMIMDWVYKFKYYFVRILAHGIIKKWLLQKFWFTHSKMVGTKLRLF